MDQLLKSLVELGFSEYEAKTYSGLVGRAPMTGYGIAKQTGVPQPKAYETLNRLAARGAVVRIGEEPATWVALPPGQLLSQLESDFQRRVTRAELELSKLADPDEQTGRVRPYWEATLWPTIQTTARRLLSDTEERLYISAHSEQFSAFEEEIVAADQRGVRIDALCFGPAPFQLTNGDVVRHHSTEGMLYPHHQARHLAVAADNRASLWALARGGDDWSAIWMDHDDLLPAIVKGFVRHDLFVQRIYRDFEAQLREFYGPGLERLVNPTAVEQDSDAAEVRPA